MGLPFHSFLIHNGGRVKIIRATACPLIRRKQPALRRRYGIFPRETTSAANIIECVTSQMVVILLGAQGPGRNLGR